MFFSTWLITHFGFYSFSAILVLWCPSEISLEVRGWFKGDPREVGPGEAEGVEDVLQSVWDRNGFSLTLSFILLLFNNCIVPLMLMLVRSNFNQHKRRIHKYKFRCNIHYVYPKDGAQFILKTKITGSSFQQKGSVSGDLLPGLGNYSQINENNPNI